MGKTSKNISKTCLEKINRDFVSVTDLDIYRYDDLFKELLQDYDYKDLCQLFGIYLDNALDAAISSKEKSMAVEIYECHKELNIVISNSFKGDIIDLKKFEQKGYTTKGQGHGKGLVFAKQILEKNTNFTSKNNICNKVYIQRIIVHN